ncbi:MAG: hypothetical protein ACI4WG_06320 [Erysipelotrichaceae bacterium]
MNIKKGFITLYFTSLLLFVSLFLALYIESIKGRIYFYQRLEVFRRMNNAEVLALNRIKFKMRTYSEQDETLTYKGCIINIYYSSTEIELVISYLDCIRERRMVYDEASETLIDYQ